VTTAGYEQGPPPEPGIGTIFIRDMGDETWAASWQSRASCREQLGRREAVVAWARAQQVERILVFDEQLDDYVVLT
jgi:hypothetical protein